MKKAVVVGLVALVFVLGVIVGAAIRPRPVAAATGSVQSWGLIESPISPSNKVLAIYDSTTGEIWGYPDLNGLYLPPVRIGKFTKVGEPIVK
jgi:hypothetical protein